MDIWGPVLEALNDVKIGYIIAMMAGYGLFRLTRINRAPDDVPSRDEVPEKTFDDSVDLAEDSKMVLIVRTDLKMGKGKIAAQCAHGAVAGYRAALKHPKLLKTWENEGQKKITLKVDSEVALKEIAKQAKSAGLLTNVIQDAGRTQIAAGSRTVCAIGPGPSTLIDQVTGHLKLF